MEVILSVESSLVQTGTTVGFAYDLWRADLAYPVGAVVRWVHTHPFPYMADYRAGVANIGVEPGPFTLFVEGYGGWWEKLGPSAILTGGTYSTNVVESLYPKWQSVAVAAGSVRYDQFDRKDYRALIDMSIAENTVRPSQAVKSVDESTRSKWLLVGSANAFAPFDHVTNSYLSGVDSQLKALSGPVEFSASVSTETAIDRVCFAGLINAQTAQVEVYVDDVLTETVSKSMIPAVDNYGVTNRTAIIPIEKVDAGSMLRVKISLTRYDTSKAIRLGVICFGLGRYLSGTEWGVETSVLSFSLKERNPAFGTTRFIKRGTARLVKATGYIDTSVVSGDAVQQMLSDVEGTPAYFDFNNPGVSYDRLQVFGFFTNMKTIISADSFESLTLDVEGLVE